MENSRKIERKRRRFAARFNGPEDIELQDEPSPCIVLCNMGQATGLQKDTILDIISDLGEASLAKYVALKGESHTYLMFTDTEGAELFYKKCNGKPLTEDGTPPAYLSYATDVPSIRTICPYRIPDGLTILQNFITEDEEKKFYALFDWKARPNLKNRLVKHYGYKFRYGQNDVDQTAPLVDSIPIQCSLLWRRLKRYGIEFEIPDQLTVNKYSPGQGIPSHVDRHSPFGQTILSLSLGASIVMDWKHHSGIRVPIEIPPRSLLVIQGEARYDWQHGIQPRTWDPVVEIRTGQAEQIVVLNDETVPRGTRISLTFRRTRLGPCGCRFKMLCDVEWEAREIEDKITSDLEERHVHQVYEQIAPHFSATRHTPWPAVVKFVQEAPPGAILLDLGAGNGKNVLPRSDLLQIACERSDRLVTECMRRVQSAEEGLGSADCVRLDMLWAPLRDACADLVLCVAVVHHFSSLARRKKAISTIARLLRPGGRALITVWARNQTDLNFPCRPFEMAPNLFTTVGGLNLPVHKKRTDFLYNDMLVPWTLRSQSEDQSSSGEQPTLMRFYHVFDNGELESLCVRPDLDIETSFYDRGNWCVICKKI